MRGLILIDKPAGWTSFDVVGVLRKHLKEKRIGHAGTLDPFATGLLVCAVGDATKLLSYLQDGTKEYSGTFRFGIRSSTDDITGECHISDAPVDLTSAQITECAAQFTGPQQQIPPAVSAVHIDGERAYRRVLRGETVVIPPRPVHIESLRVHDLIHLDDGTVRVQFYLRCSKGTYVRSIARDMGELLGCGGCVETLRRELSSPFSVSDITLSADELVSANQARKSLPAEQRRSEPPSFLEHVRGWDTAFSCNATDVGNQSLIAQPLFVRSVRDSTADSVKCDDAYFDSHPPHSEAAASGAVASPLAQSYPVICEEHVTVAEKTRLLHGCPRTLSAIAHRITAKNPLQERAILRLQDTEESAFLSKQNGRWKLILSFAPNGDSDESFN